MKQYQCSDPAQNPIPGWMANSQTPAEITAEEPEEQKEAETGLPVFTYRKAPFFPEFCILKKK